MTIRIKTPLHLILFVTLTLFLFSTLDFMTVYANEKTTPTSISEPVSGEKVFVKDEEAIKINFFLLDKEGPQLSGTALNFFINAEGKSLNYKWDVFKDSTEMYSTPYSQESFFEYIPLQAGEYRFVLTIKDENGETLTRETKVKIFDTTKIVSLTVDKKGIQPIKTPLKFTAIAEGEGLTYDWYIYKGSAIVYKSLQDKNNYVQFTPAQEGVYKAFVIARDETGLYVDKYSEEVIITASTQVMGKLTKEQAEAFVNGRNSISKTKNFIWTNTSSNMVYVFEGKNKEWTLIRAMQCTDGAPATPTIKGTFSINGRGPLLISPGNSNVRAKYKTRINGGYYFHSILYNAKGNVIDPRLGQSLSHGCVRLSLENAKWIYDNIKDGTGVFIN
jgi:lipoprotein-anchoring transpeptidase ErfK/SrfK